MDGNLAAKLKRQFSYKLNNDYLDSAGYTLLGFLFAYLAIA